MLSNIITSIGWLLGAGFVGSLVPIFLQSRKEKRQQRRAFLESQIRSLYGPLCYLVLTTDLLFDLHKRHGEAWDKLYSKGGVSPEAIKKNIEFQNIFIKDPSNGDDVETKRKEAKKLIEQNFEYIDSRDMAVFLKFIEDMVRSQKEFKDGKYQPEIAIHKQLGDISFMRPEFIKIVKERFEEKRDEWQSL